MKRSLRSGLPLSAQSGMHLCKKREWHSVHSPKEADCPGDSVQIEVRKTGVLCFVGFHTLVIAVGHDDED